MNNHATWIVILTVIVYWLLDIALGSSVNRDLMAALAIIFAFANTGRYLPPAWRAFRRGGMQDNWQLLMGNVLFWSGFGCRELWVWLIRTEDRPIWMLNSSLNGFFVLWIAGGGYLCWYAGRRGHPESIPPRRLYYLVIGLVLGLAMGVVGYRTLLGIP